MRVGTSGWTYPHWLGTFYPPELKPRDLLPAYCRLFDSVELNYSFYHLPRVSTLAGLWKNTPADFLFSVKAHRYLTHRLQLEAAGEPLANIVRRASLLQEKLGPILFQFPEKFQCDIERLAGFLELLPPWLRFTFEFRHASWFREGVYDLLKRRRCALTLADTPEFPNVLELTADFVYCRLHGSRVLYGSCYTEEELQVWATRAREWSAGGRDVFIYFDNDFLAHAPRNALRLREILGQN
ncbi:MAG: DUF72 domain-containing protein [Armatimonadetes bacterium]|nr:DUF72 domain-containing protein [Armatimonadota bacterium]